MARCIILRETNLKKLELEIEKLLDHGYKLSGSFVVENMHPTAFTYYMQMMIYPQYEPTKGRKI
ncbi:MAG: hypothetical protein ACXAC2_00650 [Candidatus Kariarchaeaceae archaeon]|jgi:hypothetical protein